MLPATEWRFGLGFVAFMAALAAAGPWLRRGAEPRCAFDGGAIVPLYRVRIVSADRDFGFCCIRCAEAWLRRHASQDGHVIVVDEESGREIDAASAYFVRNLIVTNKTTDNRTHAFATQQAATAYSQATDGYALTGDERPFRDAAGN